MWNINACVLLYCLRIVTMSLFIYSFHSLRGGINNLWQHLSLVTAQSKFSVRHGKWIPHGTCKWMQQNITAREHLHQRC